MKLLQLALPPVFPLLLFHTKETSFVRVNYKSASNPIDPVTAEFVSVPK